MDSYEYAKGITAESSAVFGSTFFGLRAAGAGFDAAMQRAILDEQAFIEACRRAAAEAKEA